VRFWTAPDDVLPLRVDRAATRNKRDNQQQKTELTGGDHVMKVLTKIALLKEPKAHIAAMSAMGQ
jgi:hypothetical protein